jgi:hypothetical protein
MRANSIPEPFNAHFLFLIRTWIPHLRLSLVLQESNHPPLPNGPGSRILAQAAQSVESLLCIAKICSGMRSRFFISWSVKTRVVQFFLTQTRTVCTFSSGRFSTPGISEPLSSSHLKVS